jgi:stage V sporulation protein AE
MQYINAFTLGGALCALGQVLIDKTNLTPARILVSYVIAGVALHAAGWFKPLAEWGGAGATVPLTGFGYALAKGVEKAVASDGWMGIFTGGLTATAGGIAAAVIVAYFAALFSKPGEKG